MELPLWLHDPAYGGMLAIDPSPALDAGLSPRPLEDTARDTLAWLLGGEAPERTDAGLDPAKERRVLDAFTSRGRC